MDPVLRGFVEAGTDDEAESRLEALIEERVGPLVKKIVSRKLAAGTPANVVPAEDLEDVASDALLMLLQRLRVVRTQSAGTIDSLDDYTAAVAYTACAHYLRRRHPQRARLKNRLRYVLERDRRFALWDVPPAGLHGGLSRWRGEEADAAAIDTLARLEESPDRRPRSWKRPLLVDRADPAPLVEEIFGVVGGPIELDRLVGLVASIWQIERPAVVPPAVFESLAAPAPLPEAAIDRRRFAERLWAEIQQLPVRQRAALLLNLRDGQGAGMLWILPVIGVASMRSIAAALDMRPEELAELWDHLPIDDNTLSSRLGCTRQQVINLRMSARKRLSNRLGRLEACSDRSAVAANPGRLSSSLGSDT